MYFCPRIFAADDARGGNRALQIKTFVLSPLRSNCYILSEADEAGASAIIIDPGDTEVQPVIDYVESRGLQVKAVWATHAHFDHVMGVDIIRQKLSVPAYVHAADMPLWRETHQAAKQWLGKDISVLSDPDGTITDGDVLRCGDLSFQVWHTPGHSPGGVCLISETVAFTGDTLFARSVGRTDLPGGSFAVLSTSLKRLLELPDDITIYPGHMGTSTIGLERQMNPFLRDLD